MENNEIENSIIKKKNTIGIIILKIVFIIVTIGIILFGGFIAVCGGMMGVEDLAISGILAVIGGVIAIIYTDKILKKDTYTKLFKIFSFEIVKNLYKYVIDFSKGEENNDILSKRIIITILCILFISLFIDLFF